MDRVSRWIVFASLIVGMGALNPLLAQNAQVARAAGDITQVQPGHLTLHNAKGDVQVTLPDNVKLLSVPPGAKDLSAATPITQSDLHPGDRAIVSGRLGDDQQSIVAIRVVVMTKSALSQFHAEEVKEWQTRGIEGNVKEVNQASGEVTIAVPNRPPTPGNLTHPVILTTTPKTTFMRYAPNSVQFSDAVASNIAAIKVGDQIRALGTASQDGTHYAAEKVISGTFHNIGATVISVDPQAHTLTVQNLATKKPVVVHVNADCKMHQLPEYAANMIARLSTGGAGPGGRGPGGGGPPAGGGPGGGGAPGAGGGHRGGLGNLTQALENMPSITLNDFKRGEPVVIFSTEGTSPSEVTAIYILTGVEPILAAQPKGGGEMNLGSWNLSLGGGSEGGEGTQ